MAIRFELGNKELEPETVLRPYLEVDEDGDLVVRCNDDNGISWNLARFQCDGTLHMMTGLPSELGFQLTDDGFGCIKLDK